MAPVDGQGVVQVVHKELLAVLKANASTGNSERHQLTLGET